MLTIALSTGHASAALWEVNYTGTVTYVQPLLGTDFTVGDTMTGTAVFDDTAPNLSVTNPFLGIYDAVSQSMTFDRLAGPDYTATSNPGPTRVSIYNNTGNGDVFLASANDVNASPVNGRPVQAISIWLQDNATETVFDSVDLPTSLDLNAFPTLREFRLSFEPESGVPFLGPYAVLGEVESITLSPVPEPGSLALLGLGGLLVTTRRQSDSSRRNTAAS